MREALVCAAVAVWLGAGVWLSIVDLRTRLLPTRAIWTAAAAVWVLLASASLAGSDSGALVGAAVGAAASGGVLATIHLISPASMGFGDVRLSVLNGLLCGWWGWPWALYGLAAGFCLALPEAAVTIARHGPRASRPLGPYLVAGSAVVVAAAIARDGLVPP